MSTDLEPFDFAKIRLFVEADLAGGCPVVLDAGQSHYLANVMRQNVGDAVLLFNGRDGEWLARIARRSKKAVELEVVSRSRQQIDTPYLALYFAPVKKLRLDFLVQKAAELGVSMVQPVVTEHTNAKVKHDRMMANVIEAAEQSGRLDVPDVRGAIGLGALLDDWSGGTLIVCDEARDAPELSKALERCGQGACGHDGPWSLLIGPEGGFSAAEREALKALDFTLIVSLGPRIMRSDTAALAALAVIQSTIGDW